MNPNLSDVSYVRKADTGREREFLVVTVVLEVLVSTTDSDHDAVTDDLLVGKAMRSEGSGWRRWEVDDQNNVPVKVACRSYRRFSHSLDRQLAKLVARWAHLAAPRARRTPRFRLRIAKPR